MYQTMASSCQSPGCAPGRAEQLAAKVGAGEVEASLRGLMSDLLMVGHCPLGTLYRRGSFVHVARTCCCPEDTPHDVCVQLTM